MELKDNVETATARLSASPSRPVDEAEGSKSAATGTPTGIRSSPPALEADVTDHKDQSVGSTEDVGVKSDSEAETIVLPGKDGHSPSKVRKTIKHEDKSEDEQIRNGSDTGSKTGSSNSSTRKDGQASEPATSSLGKRKRSKHGHGTTAKDDPAYTGNSSGLSSVPTSPVATTRSSLSKQAVSDSDGSKSPPSPRVKARDAKSVDRVLLRRKQAQEDENSGRKSNRQQSSGVEHKQIREKRTLSVTRDPNSHNRTRSNSPASRSHKRSISTQLPAGGSNGLSHKKKRVPAPLQSTEYQSDGSSASESSHPRSSRVRHLAAPTTGDSAISPAKMPHKKSGRDHHGLTLLARACSSGNLEQAKTRLEERPDDLDLADNSGNTPLQHASLKGHDHIVKFLLDAGCIVDSINVAKDTPLIDAVDNGHLEVVKLLLDAGANPRQPNVHGEEPMSRVDTDADYAEDMKAAIASAIETYKPPKDHDSRLSHPTDSPRQTPPIPTPHQQVFGVSSRRGGRSVKTSNDLLYKSSDVHELRRAAGEGEAANVARILELKQGQSGQNGWNDAETLVIAAKAGHLDIVNLLLAYSFDPDPDPLESMEPQFATPILAAIGRDGQKYLPVIQLLVDHSNFNPTRKIKGETYAEIAKKRAGTFWEKEEEVLEAAAEKYKETHKSSPVHPRSPGLRRDINRDGKRSSREEVEQPSRSHKRRLSSPKARDAETKKRENSGHLDSKRSHQRSNSSTSQTKDGQGKRGPGRPRKDERTPSVAASDRETTPLGPPKHKSQPRKSESDLVNASSDTEAVKPRRKLVSGKDLKGEREKEREKQRRASIVSSTSNASVKERQGPGEAKSGTLNSKAPRLSANDLEHDRARSLKRDDSKDRLSAIRGESPVKRQRTSVTPPGMPGSDASEGAVKRRKLDVDPNDRRKIDPNFSSSPDHRPSISKSGLSRERTTDAKDQGRRKSEEVGRGHNLKKAKRSSTSSSEAAKEHSKASADGRDEDTTMEDRDQAKIKSEREKEARIRREHEEREAKRKQEEERLEAERMEQLKQARLEKERQAEEEEEAKRLQEEAERREIQRQKDAEAAHKAQEAKRLYQEQQQKAKDDLERAKKKREAEQRAEKLKLAQQKEKERLEKLPFLLRWFEKSPEPRNAEIINLFRHMEGFRADTIKAELMGQAAGREQWLLNTHVALLLGEKDLSLSRYTSWERIDLTPDAKKAIYLYEGTKYSLTDHRLKGVRDELLGDEYGISGHGRKPLWMLDDIAKPLFIEMPMFFVKLSEFMYIVPTFPHLRGIELVVHYRELVKYPTPHPPETPKWRQDPGTSPFEKWQPRPKYYRDGIFVKQDVIRRARLMTSQEVLRKDRDRQQSISGFQFPSPTANNYRSISAGSGIVSADGQQANGITPPTSDRSINGGSPHQRPVPVNEAGATPVLPNGTSASPTSESGLTTTDVVMSETS